MGKSYEEGRFRARRNKWVINNPFLSTFNGRVFKSVNDLTDEDKRYTNLTNMIIATYTKTICKITLSLLFANI